MKQSPAMSLVEAIANVTVGYGVAVATQIVLFPLFGLSATLAQNLQMGAFFTAVSVVRSFVLRRVFEAIRVRTRKPPLGKSGGRVRGPIPWRRDFSAEASPDQAAGSR